MNTIVSLFSVQAQQGITMLEIIDTAVKVGLGALISGIATYFVSMAQQKGTTEQERRKRLAEILQEIAEQIENVNHVYLKYCALTTEALRCQRDGVIWVESRKNEREQVKGELFNVFKELTNAEAKAMLINETNISELIREYGEKVTEFRRLVVLNDNPITDDEIEKLKTDILNIRKSIFKTLSDAYKRI